MSSTEPDDDHAPGWEAINAALAPLYGDQEPLHFAAILTMSMGGDEPLQGISVYRRSEPIPHYHYVTYGFSDLFGEGEPGGDFSGFGFELTFRLKAGDATAEPPAWPLNLLQNLAKYVFKTGNFFEAGHHLNCNGPIALDTNTQIAFIAFAADPELNSIDTPQGRVDFLQIVGLVADEYETIKHWRTDRLLAILERQYPLLITDLMRGSILSDPAIATEVSEAAAKEGSLQTSVFAMVNRFVPQGDTVRLQLSANVIGDLLLMFDNQLLRGNSCSVIGKPHVTEFRPVEDNQWSINDQVLSMQLTAALAQDIRRSLKIERGEYRWDALPHFVLEVVPTEIKDQDGRVVAVIG